MKTPHLRMPAYGLAIVVLSGLAVTRLAAQAPGGAAPPDYSKVEIQTSQLAPSFYRFEAVGPVLVGNAGAFTGPDGVLLVDAMFAQLNDKLVGAIKKVSDGRIRFLVNTHHHPDHTSGNANFGAMGVTLLGPLEPRGEGEAAALRQRGADGNDPEQHRLQVGVALAVGVGRDGGQHEGGDEGGGELA